MRTRLATSAAAAVLYMVATAVVATGLVANIAAAQSPAPPPPPVAKSASPTAKPANAAEIEFWSGVKDSKNPDELKAYLETYPTGAFAALAKVRLKALAGGGSAPASAPVATAPAGATKIISIEAIKEVQVRLHAMNFPITAFDGQLNAEVVEAMRRWQTQNKFQPTGQLTDAEMILLRAQKPPTVWGAIAFTARESYIVSNKRSRMEAETTVMGECNSKGGKDCKSTAVPLSICAAAAGFREQMSRGTASGISVSRGANLSIAQIQALAICGRQPESRGRCEIVSRVCGDGSHINTTPTAPKTSPKKEGSAT